MPETEISEHNGQSVVTNVRPAYAVCPRIERSETRLPKLFDSLTAAKEFLRAEVEFPLDDEKLAVEFSRSAKQEYIGGINQLHRAYGTGLTIKDVRRRKSNVQQQADEPLLNNTQGWRDPVPVSRAAQYTGPKCNRTLRGFLPIADVGLMPKVTPEAEIKRALQKWNPAKSAARSTDDYTCYLDKDWHFDDIETDAWKRAGHEFSGRRHGSIGEIVLAAAYDLEAALGKFHPNAPCAAVADFWRSWQVQSHIAHFCWELADTDMARFLVGNSAAEEAARARVHIWRQIAAYAHELSDEAIPLSAAEAEMTPNDAPKQKGVPHSDGVPPKQVTASETAPETNNLEARKAERNKLRDDYKAESKRAGVIVTDEMIAKAANPPKGKNRGWTSRTHIHKWMACHPKYDGRNDQLIRAVFLNKPHLEPAPFEYRTPK
jgi:hypothetical protein